MLPVVTTLVREQLHPWGLALADGCIHWSRRDLIPINGPLTNGKMQTLVLQ